MPDLTERLQHAAQAAIGDLGPSLERDRKRVRSVLFELDINGLGQVTGAHAWLDYRVGLSKLLAGPAVPGGSMAAQTGGKS